MNKYQINNKDDSVFLAEKNIEQDHDDKSAVNDKEIFDNKNVNLHGKRHYNIYYDDLYEDFNFNITLTKENIFNNSGNSDLLDRFFYGIEEQKIIDKNFLVEARESKKTTNKRGIGIYTE